MQKLMGDQDSVAANLSAYVQAFSPTVRDIFDNFLLADQLVRLQKAELLYQVTERFSRFDLSPQAVTNHDMGLVFEKLIRRFSDLSNETGRVAPWRLMPAR
jgi:type I restriction enzyme M protein